MTTIQPSRYASVFSESLRQWQVRDKETGNLFGRFDTKRQSDRRATQLQMKYNEKKRADFGMKHPVDAPKPRAYID